MWYYSEHELDKAKEMIERMARNRGIQKSELKLTKISLGVLKGTKLPDMVEVCAPDFCFSAAPELFEQLKEFLTT